MSFSLQSVINDASLRSSNPYFNEESTKIAASIVNTAKQSLGSTTQVSCTYSKFDRCVKALQATGKYSEVQTAFASNIKDPEEGIGQALFIYSK